MLTDEFISIHRLLAEPDLTNGDIITALFGISIHRLLAEPDEP